MPEPFYIEKLISDLIEKKRKNFKGTQEEFDKRLEEDLPEQLRESFEKIAEETLEELGKAVAEEAVYKSGISTRIIKKYGNALSYFDMFLELNKYIGRDFYPKFHKIFDKYEDQIKLDTLILIHTRACQIAGEIRLLLEGGFADGAHARWRSLHELNVIFLFLYDNDYTVIQMYNDYEIIESVKKASEYCERLWFKPLPQEEVEEMEQAQNKLLEKYGKDFGRSYGWTKTVISNPRARNFREIEKRVGKEYLRGVYAWASENVHGGISANIKKLGLPEEKDDYLLPTSSEFGITDPAQFATYSLYDISEVLLNMKDSVLNNLYSDLLTFLQNEVVRQLDKVNSTTRAK